MLTEDDELSVQGTASEALISKSSAVRVGYYKDDFLPLFCRRKDRKPPLINRGYYARVQSINLVVQKFLRLTEDLGETRQVLVLGGGYDTTCLKLLQDKTTNLQCFEVDFPALIDRKAFLFMSADLIRETLELNDHENPNSSSSNDGGMPPPTTGAGLHRNTTATAAVSSRQREYGYDMGPALTLISADMKRVDTLLSHLDASRFDFTKPTLLVSECVIVYMDKASVVDLCSGLADRFKQTSNPRALWVSYDMFNPMDQFGKVMLRNLSNGGISVPGLTDYPTLEAQQGRFTETGWAVAESISMAAAFRDVISPRDHQRISRLEIFDELEEWEMIMSHYCLSLASIGCNDPSTTNLGTIKLNPSIRPDDDVTNSAADGKASSLGAPAFRFHK